MCSIGHICSYRYRIYSPVDGIISILHRLRILCHLPIRIYHHPRAVTHSSIRTELLLTTAVS